MKLKLFTSKTCPNCPNAKKVCEELEKEGVNVEYYDTDDPDGMAEAAFHSVMSTPTSVFVDAEDNELESWRGIPPDSQKVHELLKNFG